MDNSSGWFNAENGTGGASVVQNFFNPRNAYGVSLVRHHALLYMEHGLHSPLRQRTTVGAERFCLIHRRRLDCELCLPGALGQPYNLTVGGDVANISGDNGSVTGYSRPNVVGNPTQGTCGATPIGKRGPNGFCEYNSSAFAIPSGSFGDMAKMPYRQPYYNNLDFSLVKQTPLFENVSLELRAESFNTYNAMIMGSPGSTVGNSSAGLATGIANTPRELQFGAKITF